MGGLGTRQRTRVSGRERDRAGEGQTLGECLLTCWQALELCALLAGPEPGFTFLIFKMGMMLLGSH